MVFSRLFHIFFPSLLFHLILVLRRRYDIVVVVFFFFLSSSSPVQLLSGNTVWTVILKERVVLGGLDGFEGGDGGA
jgi:hypothetical protein